MLAEKQQIWKGEVKAHDVATHLGNVPKDDVPVNYEYMERQNTIGWLSKQETNANSFAVNS